MAKVTKKEKVAISPPNLPIAEFHIVGTAPYRQNKFSHKARITMIEAQEAGSAQRGKRKAKPPKNFDEMYRGCIHSSPKGWKGIPASAFRNALISACRLVEFTMTRAKLSLFCIADGHDETDGTPLVRITRGTPRRVDVPCRLESGVMDIHPLPQWDAGWEAHVKIQYDANMFTLADITNLFLRVGIQVGIGEGRHDSRKANGMGLGTFKLK